MLTVQNGFGDHSMSFSRSFIYFQSGQWCAGGGSYGLTMADHVSLSNSLIKDIMLVVCKWPWWEYLHHGNQQVLQTGTSFSPESWLLNVYQHTMGYMDFSRYIIDIQQQGSSWWLKYLGNPQKWTNLRQIYPKDRNP